MNTRKVDKREQHVRKKLTAAILMLLISCIMTVTSTYAWFTLSTAPEVTGIQTTIGGNGNLEIALANGITWKRGRAYEYEEYTALVGEKDVNTSYGNLVDLGQTVSVDNLSNKYGLDNIVLYPAALNYDVNDAKKVSSTSLLSYPEYGTDGRITELKDNTVSGVIGENGFTTSGYGVRAIGATSSMSEREFAYRNAMSDIKSYKEATVEAVNKAISLHGDHLASIAVNYAAGSNEFSRTDLEGLQAMIVETKTGVKKVETAIINVIKAAVASKDAQATLDDDTFNLILNAYNGLTYNSLTFDESTVDGVKTLTKITVNLSDTVTFPITNDFVLGLVEKYNYINDKLDVAANKANLDVKDSYSWSEISGALSELMNVEDSENVFVAGKQIDYLKNNIDEAASILLGEIQSKGAVTVSLGEDSSVYYDIAELVGKISSKVTTSVEYNGIPLNNMNIYIVTPETTPLVDTAYTGVNTLLQKPVNEGTSTSKIDDIYAFALDFFVRTNASNSKLLLQIDPEQRIYDSSSNVETMGNGSTMTFESASLTEKEMANLLENVRIMFISADENTDRLILAEGRLDVGYQTDTNGEITSKNYTLNPQGAIVANIRLWDKATSDFITEDDAQEILDLNKGQEHKLTVLVYLDGRTVSNADVSVFSTSMTGKMNLQFASNADLQPMDYSGLSESGLGGTVTELPSTNISFDEDTKKLTVSKVENATSYTYSINGEAAQSLNFADDSNVVEIEIDDETRTVTVVATSSNPAYSSSTTIWTRPTVEENEDME